MIVAIAGNAVENFAGARRWPAAAARTSRSPSSRTPSPRSRRSCTRCWCSSPSRCNTRLTFTLPPVYIGALLLTTLALDQITSDGEAAEFEGWALVALYVILAVVALFE